MRYALLCLSLFACGKGAPPSDAGSASAPAADQEVASTPGDAASRAFARALIKAEFTDFKPADAVGAVIQYDRLGFQADNTWQASGYVAFEDEKMSCSEGGTWSMDPADSETTATVAWTVAQTNCAGRTAGTEARAKITLEPGQPPQFSFR
jgi:hypothetical protein